MYVFSSTTVAEHSSDNLRELEHCAATQNISFTRQELSTLINLLDSTGLSLYVNHYYGDDCAEQLMLHDSTMDTEAIINSETEYGDSYDIEYDFDSAIRFCIESLDYSISAQNKVRYPSVAKLCKLYEDRDILTKALIKINKPAVTNKSAAVKTVRKESRIPC